MTVLLALLRGTRERVILLTPYFNLPRPVRLVLGQLLRRGCRIDIMVGDKTASDFFIPPGQPFKTIGLLPYLYENNLRRFARAHRRQIDAGQLNLYLWRDGDNSYHLKGLFVDDDVAVLTGHNLNPRAWSLDLENALAAARSRTAAACAASGRMGGIAATCQPAVRLSCAGKSAALSGSGAQAAEAAESHQAGSAAQSFAVGDGSRFAKRGRASRTSRSVSQRLTSGHSLARIE